MVWLIPKLWRFIARLVRRVGGVMSGTRGSAEGPGRSRELRDDQRLRPPGSGV